MNLTRWEPFKEAEDFFRMSAPLFGRWPRQPGNGDEITQWSPAADISETETEYLVKAELPGVKREDVKVTLEDGCLTIQGERREQRDEKKEKSRRIERFYGSFYRQFLLPDNADSANVRADCKDGVLNIHVPKLKVERSRAVEIKVQ